MKVLSIVIRQEKFKKMDKIENEKVTLPLFADCMVMYIRNTKVCINRLERIREFIKVEGTKINYISIHWA